VTAAVSESDREHLHQTFEALCRTPSPTGDERGVADWVTRELAALGISVEEDDAGAAVGSNAGNLLAKLPGTGERTLMFCAHMDTVPLTAPVEPVRRDDGWENANEGILGADNKAAVAALLQLARLLVGEQRRPEVGVEFLFTVAEETGLNGARNFDVGRLSSRFGYVFDHASPLGEIITASPTQMRIDAEVRGKAAHAGLHPENGVSAIVAAARAIANMPQGRFDPETTANVGMVSGGTATNVVPDRCTVSAEVRAVEQDQVDRYVTQAIDALQDAADTAGCDLDLKLHRVPERPSRGAGHACRQGPAQAGLRAELSLQRGRLGRERLPRERLDLHQHRQRDRASARAHRARELQRFGGQPRADARVGRRGRGMSRSRSAFAV